MRDKSNDAHCEKWKIRGASLASPWGSFTFLIAGKERKRNHNPELDAAVFAQCHYLADKSLLVSF